VPYKLPALVARYLDVDQGFARSLTKAVRRPSRNLLVNQGHRPGHAQPSGGVGPTRNKVVFAREPISCRYAPLLTLDLTANIPIRRLRVKMRNTHPEQMFSALPPESGLKSDIAPSPLSATSRLPCAKISVGSGIFRRASCDGFNASTW
jgi:hypothetical protein